MNDSENEENKYYEEMGWLSPTELSLSAVEAAKVDIGLGAWISFLAVLRLANNLELEKDTMAVIQKYLRERIPSYDEQAKQFKSGWN